MSLQVSPCAAMSLRSAGYPITASGPHSGSDFGERRTHPSHACTQEQREILSFRSASAGSSPSVKPSAAKGFPAKALRMRREWRR